MASSLSPPSSQPSYSIEFNLSEVTLLYAELFVLARNKNSEEDTETLRCMLDKIKIALVKKEPEFTIAPEIDPVMMLRSENARLKAQVAIYEQFVEEIGKDGIQLLERLSKSLQL